MTKENNTYFLMCERKWIFHILIFVQAINGADVSFVREIEK